MKQIKTILRPLDAHCEFDTAVNAELAAGWVLTKREVLLPLDSKVVRWNRLLYAELEKETVEDETKLCENCMHFDNAIDQAPCDRCIDECYWEAVRE